MFEIFKPLLVNFWALFFTIDILGTLPIFISLTANYSRPFQKKMAFKAPLTAFVILLILQMQLQNQIIDIITLICHFGKTLMMIC